MLPGKSRWYIFVFTIGLLIFATTIRSDVIVDKSFLPRFLLTSLLLLLVWIAAGNRLAGEVPFNLFVFSFVLLYCWNLLSSLWAISGSEAIMQSQLVFTGLAVFLTISAIAKEQPMFESFFIKTLFFTLAFSFGLAWYQMHGLPFYDPYKITSLSANNNLYSGFLLLSIPLLVNGYLKNNGVWRYLLLLAGILAVFFIVILQSRAVYIGLCISIIAIILFIVVRYRSVFTRRNIYTVSASLILLFVLCGIFYSSLDPLRKEYFKSKLAVLNYVPVLTGKDAAPMDSMVNSGIPVDSTPAFDLSAEYYQNANLRVIFWKKSLGLIKSSPVKGVGAGNWRIAVASIPNPPNPEHTLRNYTYSQPHNEWIAIISELGIAGFLLALCLFILPLVIIFRRIAFVKSKPGIDTLIYSSFILGFYVYSIFDFPLRRVEHTVLFFSIMAFLLRKEEMSFGSIRLKKIPYGIFSICVILLLIISLAIGWARIKGEYFTLKMFKNERKNDRKVIDYSQKAENIFYQITPNALPLAWFEGVALFRLGYNSSAMDCFSRALKSTPYEVRVLNDYGTSLFNLNETSKAKGFFVRCYEIDPDFDDAKFNLAAIYFFNRQLDSARFYVNTCRSSQKKTDFLKELN